MGYWRFFCCRGGGKRPLAPPRTRMPAHESRAEFGCARDILTLVSKGAGVSRRELLVSQCRLLVSRRMKVRNCVQGSMTVNAGRGPAYEAQVADA